MQEIIQEEARLYAIEYVLLDIAVMFYRSRGLTREQLSARHKAALEKGAAHTVPELDAAMSDVAADDTRAAVARLLAMIEEAYQSPPASSG
jgi:hypothetical protein